MKPTVSYVRGLRDILEIGSREDRREYIMREPIIPNFLVCSSGTILAIGAISALLSEPTPQSKLAIYSMYLGSLVPVGICTIRGIVDSYRHKKIERVARAHQANRRKNIPVPGGLEKDLL